ncbi:MAG TPA: LysR family transcriptional regulator [Paracoccaceae bacterium]|nr:LysR family transcriptional regulator [Paracoccaceae bacterium]
MVQEDWDDLRFVLAVSEEGTVSAAARRLGVNHATVLRRIARFEDRCGQIFDKTPRGYVLAQGQAGLLAAAREVERAVLGVGRVLAGARMPLSGEVRITSTDSFCQMLLPPILALIGAEAPDLRLTLISSNTPLDLGRIEADITVRPAVRLPEELVGEKAGVLGFRAYRARHARRALAWLSLAGRLAQTVPGRWLSEQKQETSAGGADSFLTLRELAAHGCGLAILPAILGDADARLERVPSAMPDLSVDIWVASHADLAEVPRIARTRQRLADAIRAEGARLAG